MRAALRGGVHRRGVGDVAGDELDAPRSECTSPLGSTHECAHVAVLGAQRVHDLRADEPVRTGDEDLHAKFCQYRDGVGPRCPWYFEPREELPYGVDVGSVSCMKEIWPIFMPW